MRFFDIHTHNPAADKEHAILDCGARYTQDQRISMGIHPWHIPPGWEETFAAVRQSGTRANVAAIGECGIDKLRSSAAIELQKEIFRAHAILAEEVEKPLIIHCVKGIEEIIAAYKEMAPRQAWIIHAFRGKKQEAQQLARAGLYLSLGEKFNNEGAAAIPAERLLIETDESRMPISEIYRLVADARQTTAEKLKVAVARNIKVCGIDI